MGRDTGEELGKTARTRVAESVDVAASEVSSVEVAGLVPELALFRLRTRPERERESFSYHEQISRAPLDLMRYHVSNPVAKWGLTGVHILSSGTLQSPSFKKGLKKDISRAFAYRSIA